VIERRKIQLWDLEIRKLPHRRDPRSWLIGYSAAQLEGTGFTASELNGTG
jgi:hypothetical protein